MQFQQKPFHLNKTTEIIRRIAAIIILLLPLLSFGQKDFNWENKIPVMSPIPDSLSTSNAVVISYFETRKIEKEKSFINTNITIRKKIKLLTKQGIKEHSFFRIKQSKDMIVEILDARTIKPNGVILDFESSQIKSIESKTQLSGKIKDLFFAIPGVEIGDEVEMICKYNVENFQSNDLIYFNQNIPVLKSTFTIDVPKKILIKSNVYSELKLPTVQYNLYSNQISWKCNQLKGIDPSAINYHLPHLIYQLDYSNLIVGNSTFDDWYELINHYEKVVFKPKIRNQKKFDAFWNVISQGETDSSILIEKIHQYLNQHMKVTPLLDYETSEGVEYFLERKKADQTTLLKLYFALLKKAKIDGKLAIGKSSNLGPLDLRIPTSAQISNFILVIENKKGITLISPKDEQAFDLHQLPKLLHDTYIYMLSNKKRKKLLRIKIPPINLDG